ncbi:MAG: hypothetical protein Q7T10_07155 [Rhodoferax sp.]|uniref:transposase n=1 Tax=Rhodoferax sp. TaxID=50421 RepID=UPI00271DFB20|nr:hypothetical protein [Rhodoferax sp.]MDO8448569.1 hypothetical protein [Rhodoferax sp.]
MKKADLDLYTDYLLSTFGAATATGLSAMVEGDVSHDQITRLLSAQDYMSKDLWQQVKRTVRLVEREDGVLIFDDTIQEKAWTDESELMCWHFDHCSGRNTLYTLNYTEKTFQLIDVPGIEGDERKYAHMVREANAAHLTQTSPPPMSVM